MQCDPESLQGSVINHSSACTYIYGHRKDAWYWSYVLWKFMGIMYPKCGNRSNGQTEYPCLG
eukprot:1015354-Ditylum_brightwellii.AAC.1